MNVLGMPRTARVAPGGMVFHVLNRANRIDLPLPRKTENNESKMTA